MEKNPKRDILALVNELTPHLDYEAWSSANGVLAKLRPLLGNIEAEIHFSDEECQLLVDTCSALISHGASYPSLLKLIKAGCSCNEQIALLEQRCELSMERQVLAETIARLEKLSPKEIDIFISGKDTIAAISILSEADLVLLEKAKLLAKNAR